MSQSSFLESVVTWDERQCRNSLKEALPKLISHFQESEVVQEELGILKIICLSFLPLVPIEEAEEILFSPVTSKTYGVLDRLLLNLQDTCKQSGMVSELQQLLQLLMELLDCYTVCIKHVLDQGRQSTVDLANIHSLPYGAVHLLKGTYNHCKTSSDVYSDVLPAVAETLSQLFKRAHALQVSFLSLLENVSVEASQQHVEDLCYICQGLFEVCQMVTSLDMKLVCSLWKTISRLCGRHKSLLRSEVNMDVMVSNLCQEISTSYIYLFQLATPQGENQELSLSQGDSAALQKSLKVVNYQLRILVSLLDNYVDYVSHCVLDLLRLVICIYSNLPPCLGAPMVSDQHVGEIRQQVQYSVEPMVGVLVTNRTFIQLVISEDGIGESEDPCAHLLLLVKIMDSLPRQTDEVIDQWLRPSPDHSGPTKQGLVHCVFEAVSRCYVELSVPVMLKGTNTPSAGDQSLYEYTCTHLCSLLAAMPARHFGTVEQCLVSQVLSHNFYTSCLAGDVWCFMARYGTAELCHQQTCYLMALCLSLVGLSSSSVPCRNLLHLLARLIKFLAPEQQLKFLQQYPPINNLPVFKDLPLSVFPVALRTDVAIALYTEGMTVLQQFLNMADKLYNDLASLVPSLQCLASLLDQQTAGHLALPDPSPLMDAVTQLWTRLDTGQWSSDPLLTTCFTHMIKIFTYTSKQLSNLYILKALTTSISPQTCSGTCLKITIAKFLLHCGKLKFQPDAQQPQILSRLPQMFSTLLSDPHCLVHHVTLETFTQFAESTPYENLVAQCIGSSEMLQDAVVAFLNKTVHISPTYNQLDHLRHQQKTSAGYQPSTNTGPSVSGTKGCTRNQSGDMLDEIGSSCQPNTKRKRIEEDQETDDIDGLISSLDRGMAHLEELCLSGSFPTSKVCDLQSINSRLKGVIANLQK